MSMLSQMAMGHTVPFVASLDVARLLCSEVVAALLGLTADQRSEVATLWKQRVPDLNAVVARPAANDNVREPLMPDDLAMLRVLCERITNDASPGLVDVRRAVRAILTARWATHVREAHPNLCTHVLPAITTLGIVVAECVAELHHDP